MEYRVKPSETYKKIKPNERKSSKKNMADIQDMPDIIPLINLSNEERKAKLVSKYVRIISEFILQKAKEISGENEKISTNDIKSVIVSEGLFFLSEIINLGKQ
ncbi:hypothetical protein EHEL_090360 [Encephalitozoon hellem ATCC 50504]|uniref:Uncharacterized protein n=1 Tax=Encephalitozoon hellem TaxID=27973 RepID=A0A9Q9FC68_ENCHE|nr:uncharacterized protein EHEL_090360 [Encephalitozoon hellem ATCC 50504]AFM98932.1 hypothetical protein EHEL_090360 [Encephalitozoon hellem ATCC 50504]UTX43945.1 hypothetical protein GPU96_09g17250 [Encephalitozoon hellem]WEL39429.1 hypothetical protein PFJ87_09g00560 [Encephalitozoon hellem]|eukprot:XP_003887913.1 hypothetical protein EHEL_090360 [Encephalitozoon hellem ATCC 50504]